jgi:hypothetical protein
MKAEWFHPFTGQRQDAGTLAGGSSEIKPPAAWGDGPVVLHVGSSQR